MGHNKTQNIYIKRIKSVGYILLMLFLVSLVGLLGVKGVVVTFVPIGIMWYLIWDEITYRYGSKGGRQ